MPYVVISYSRSDGEYVTGLTRHLTAAGLDVWTDRRLDGHHQWSAELERQLDGCGVFVPVMSPRSKKSEWVDREVLHVLRRHRTIKPLLLEGTPFLTLEDLPYEDVRGGRLPSAAFVNELRLLTGSVWREQQPVRVVGWGSETRVPKDLTDVTSVAAGHAHSLAVHRDGRVTQWGRVSGRHERVIGIFVDVMAVSAGHDFSLALHRKGEVTAWGNNDDGRSTLPRSLTGVVAIAAGQAHALALLQGGDIAAWGRNEAGQTSVPRLGTQVVAIAAGGAHSLALRRDGRVVAWGSDDSGQASVPAGLTKVVAIAAGFAHSVALHADGRVTTWGRDHGQAEYVEKLADVTAIAAGFDYSLAVHEDGLVSAWGTNDNGPLLVPKDLTNVINVAAGSSHCLAIVRA